MDIKDLNSMDFVDLFPETGNPKAPQEKLLRFGQEDMETNILQTPVTTTDTTTIAPTPVTSTDTTTLPPVKEGDDVDLLTKVPKIEEKKPEELKGIADYFQKGLKEGKFVKITETNDKGEEVVFVPKTMEDFDEVIDIQINHGLEKAKKDLDQKWYNSKSPAWKAISQYAEMVDDPTELIPFMQGVRNIQSVASLNPEEIDGAENIVRSRLEQRGDPEEAISSQIEALKTTDKLISTAKQYKPVMIQEEQQLLARQVQEKTAEHTQWVTQMNTIREGAYKSIEQPIFGKQKLKRDEQAAVYDLIAQPDEQGGGFKLFSEIDKLFDKGDFETLKQIALLISNKDAFYGYLGTDVANKTAASLQRKLQVAAESRTSTANDFNEEKVPAVNRTVNRQVRFGK